MKKLLYLSLGVIALCNSHITGQRNSKVDFSIFFSHMVHPITSPRTNLKYSFHEYYTNASIRYQVKRKLYIGAEYNHIILTGEQFANPYYSSGLFVDYDLLKHRNMALTPRIGLTIGNLVLSNIDIALKKNVKYYSGGISFDCKAYRKLWLYTGFYNQILTKKIIHSFSIWQPFIGVRIKFN